MFTKDITLTGKHAYYTKFLSPRNELEERIFDRYIDVYMSAAIIGFIYGEKEEKDKSSEYANEAANILLGAIQRERQNLLFIYRTIMLLEGKEKLTEEERIERAFKDDLYNDRTDKQQDNMELFISYVRGGISFLYKKVTENAVSKEERIANIKEFVEDFHNEFILEKHLEDIDYEEDQAF